ncbi:MAG: glycosyltransferase family 2 protein [Prevotella sp.]|nr:glycosyltransferase family 2 protein [Prevotella sp.]
MSKIAIVILNWNGLKMLTAFLPTVIRYSLQSADIIVADNASTDGSVEYLKAHFPEVRIICLEKNWGFAEGYNQALKQVEADYYVLLNSDVEVTDGWLSPLVQYMDLHAEVCACQPKLLAVHNRDSFEYAGACGGFIDRFGYPFCRGRIFDVVESDNGQYNSPMEIFWATGACMMIRSADYWAVGGFDADFFAHNEEIDLCWRLQLQGRKIVCLPESRVYHVGGGTLPKGNPMKTFLNFRNNLTMLYKNLPDEELRGVMLWRWFLDYVAAWQTLVFNRNLGDFKAIYRARRAFRRWLPQYKSVRARIKENRKVNEIPQKKKYSILWQYYVRRRKRFDELP